MNGVQTVVGKAKAMSNVVRTEVVKRVRAGDRSKRPEELHQAISVVAYYLAEGRNLEPGHEMEDWLNAEAQVLAEMEGMQGFPA
jgi:hypothetical protein